MRKQSERRWRGALTRGGRGDTASELWLPGLVAAARLARKFRLDSGMITKALRTERMDILAPNRLERR